MSQRIDFKISEVQARPSDSCLFLPPANPDVEFSAPSLASCLLVNSHVSYHDKKWTKPLKL